MSTYQQLYAQQAMQEIEATPDEYLPTLLEMIRLFRQSVSLKPAIQSFRQGWQEATDGETLPIEDLWVGIEDE